MMLENLMGLSLLLDRSVGSTPDPLQKLGPIQAPSLFDPITNLDRCSSRGGEYALPNRTRNSSIRSIHEFGLDDQPEIIPGRKHFHTRYRAAGARSRESRHNAHGGRTDNSRKGPRSRSLRG